ncbi:hypothetical protein LCGC14_0698800 [marine sediment metagenome]|uniref:Uncharacterized protein n=1 Tax=marine sediment metagenome TaxID=412755 RepID=A0A0F9T4C3_9ZZZZ
MTNHDARVGLRVMGQCGHTIANAANKEVRTQADNTFWSLRVFSLPRQIKRRLGRKVLHEILAASAGTRGDR